MQTKLDTAYRVSTADSRKRLFYCIGFQLFTAPANVVWPRGYQCAGTSVLPREQGQLSSPVPLCICNHGVHVLATNDLFDAVHLQGH